ncbi:hypothetical protein [Streptomyces sp. CH-036]|uniref:hypothetical protein n=1 Tax=Streptomyces sp. CH-036 TaxID=3406733 RepID=UPI003C715D02
MRFSSDDLVCRIACNLEQVHTADEAMRAWLPLVSELRPVSAAFEAAHPDGLRRGYLADLLVVLPLPEDGAGGGSTRSRLLAAVDALAVRLGLDPADFETDRRRRRSAEGEGRAGRLALRRVSGARPDRCGPAEPRRRGEGLRRHG